MASVVVNGDTSGAVTLSAPAVAGTVTVTLPATSGTMLTTASSTGVSGSAISSGTVAEAYGGTGTSTGYYGFKNRIINGAMVIDQRNAGAAITLATNIAGFPVDRLVMYKGTAGATVTGQQASASIAGFEKCAVWTTTVASAPAAGDINGIWQVIEGLNTLDLQWGTANAKACTVSFWFKATTAGTYALAVNSGNVDVSYVVTFSATSTFTYFSFSIPAPTTGTFSKTNTQAMYVTIDAGSGTNYNTATTGSWIAGNFKRTSACVNSTANTNTLSLTGFQFEVGSTATSFDYRPYGTELALCQRYFETLTSVGGSSVYVNFLNGGANSATQARYVYNYQVQKRSSPSVTFTTASGFSTQKGDDSLTTCTALVSEHLGINSCQVTTTVASGLTAGATSRLIANGVSTAVISCSAEL